MDLTALPLVSKSFAPAISLKLGNVAGESNRSSPNVVRCQAPKGFGRWLVGSKSQKKPLKKTDDVEQEVPKEKASVSTVAVPKVEPKREESTVTVAVPAEVPAPVAKDEVEEAEVAKAVAAVEKEAALAAAAAEEVAAKEDAAAAAAKEKEAAAAAKKDAAAAAAKKDAAAAAAKKNAAAAAAKKHAEAAAAKEKATAAAAKKDAAAKKSAAAAVARIAELEAANGQLQERVAELEAALKINRLLETAIAPIQPRAVPKPIEVAPVDGALKEAPVKEKEVEAPKKIEAPEEIPAPNEPEVEIEALPLVDSGLPSWTSIKWPSPKDDVPFWLQPVPAAPPRGTMTLSAQDNDRLSITHITAELAPMAKVGGLGDVVTGLARACLTRGHDVQVVLPFYDCMDLSTIEGLELAHTFRSFHRGDWIGVQAHVGKILDVPLVLIKPENHFFQGPRIYGGSYNELEAYLFFARAALEYLQMTKQQPAILHVHEWHTAAVGMLYWDMYHWLDLKKPRLVLTIHNMEHHGECKWEELDWCGLDGQSYLTVEKAMDERTIGHNPERLSLLKGGIVYSNAVTTVSPTYVQETLCSGWLSSTLHTHRQKYSGILNGIDTQMWDPSADPFLPAPFAANDLRGKAMCKHYVQLGLGLDLELPVGVQTGADPVPEKRIPLVVCVTRLVAQKGIHLIRHALYRTLEQGGQFILLGSAPDPRIQGEFERLAEEFRDSKNARLLLTYSESLSHFLYAAGDMVLVPSMFEPCGLTQMIGMRYGMVPVVRRTGGLADTVFDVDSPADQSRGNGFVFDGIDEGSLNNALDRGLQYYTQRPDWWAELTAKVMKIDNSWIKSAGEYLDLYRSVKV